MPLAVAGVTPVHACSGPSSIPDVAFRGHLTGASASAGHTGLHDESFTVTEVFKGSVNEHVTVKDMPGHPGDLIDILATNTHEGLRWTYCADFDTSVMVPGRGYAPSPDPNSWPLWVIVGGSGLAPILVLIVILRLRRAAANR